MSIPIAYDEDIEVLLTEAYPNLTDSERKEVRLDLELVCRWLLEQVELENPALKIIQTESDGHARET